LDRNMILEIQLLRFSTGQPHPLTKQPTIFITTKAVFIGYTIVNIEIVGDFLALLITFNEGQDENEDMFFLVHWKKGEMYCNAGSRARLGNRPAHRSRAPLSSKLKRCERLTLIPSPRTTMRPFSTSISIHDSPFLLFPFPLSLHPHHHRRRSHPHEVLPMPRHRCTR
jgi:hypothetical protein